MNSPDYVIVESRDAKELAELVKKLMKLGWVLSGGVSSDNRTHFLIQAMFFPAQETPSQKALEQIAGLKAQRP